MGLTVTEDTPADMLAGNMELLVQLPPRNNDDDDDDDYVNDETYEGDDDEHRRSHHRYRNHHITNGHHPRRPGNGNARRVTVARSTPMMDLLVQVATSQKLSASSYTLEAIGEHGLVLTHHPNTPIGALDALQVKLLPKQGTFAPMKTRHANQPFETTFRLQVHLPRNQLYVSRVSSRMNLGKILDEVCREKNLDRNNYELRHPANIEETLDLSLSLQDYHLQEVTLCPKRRPLGSSLSSQDIMALQRQEERRRQEAKQSVFGFAFKKSKESSLSTDSLGERSVSPARSDGTGRSASPQAPQAPTRPQRKRRPAPKPPLPRAEVETSLNPKGPKHREKDNERERDSKERERERERADRTIISHSRNSSDSSGYHEASVLSDNLDSNIRAVPETLPRRSRLQTPSSVESPGRTLAETSQASKSLGNLAAASSNQKASTIARGTSNSSLSSAGLRKKKAAPAPPPPRPLTSSTSTQALERIVDSEESVTSVDRTSLPTKASSDVAVAATKSRLQAQPRVSLGSEVRASVTPKIDELRVEEKPPAPVTVDSGRSSNSPILSENSTPSPVASPSPKVVEVAAIIPNVEIASERKRVAPVPKPRGLVHGLDNAAKTSAPPKSPPYLPSPTPRDQTTLSTSNLDRLEIIPNKIVGDTTTAVNNLGNHEPTEGEPLNHSDVLPTSKPTPITRAEQDSSRVDRVVGEPETIPIRSRFRNVKVPEKPKRKTLEGAEISLRENGDDEEETGPKEVLDRTSSTSVQEIDETTVSRVDKRSEVSNDHEKTVQERRFDYTKTRRVVAQRKQIIPGPGSGHSATKDPEIRAENNESAAFTDCVRSCAVISTIPKCDNFQRPKSDDDEKRTGSESPDYETTGKVDSTSIGVAFGAGKPISEKDRNQPRRGSKSVVNADGTDNELELENFEMFERPKKTPAKWSKVLRSHSALNNFEINTFEGGGRPLTSRSVDFTFALNPNLARNISDLSTDAYPTPGKHTRHTATDANESNGLKPADAYSDELPPFLADIITWERWDYLEGGGYTAEDKDKDKDGDDDDDHDHSEPDAAVQIAPKTSPETTTTTDLLKKVSDTLSSSLIQQPAAVAAVPSLAKDLEPPAESKKADEPMPRKEESVSRPDIGKDVPDFIEADHQPVLPDWEYQLPEPPSGFRDTEEPVSKEGGRTLNAEPEPVRQLQKLTADEEPKDKTVVEAKRREVSTPVAPSPKAAPINDDDADHQSKLSRRKSGSETSSRRTSHVSSTPGVAPVDNTLSNFMITTYSRPKNVDIFDEIGRTDRDTEAPTSRKSSSASQTRRESPRSSTSSLPQSEERQLGSPPERVTQQRPEDALPVRGDADSSSPHMVSRANIKISIAPKPRSRGESVSGNQALKAAVRDASDDGRGANDIAMPDEKTTTTTTMTSNNEKFSQWRENILKKQETPSRERQLQSLQVLRGISPQIENSQRQPDDTSTAEKPVHTSSVETRIEAVTVLSNGETTAEPSPDQGAPPAPVAAPIEPHVKRYTYAGPPAIDLGSWSDRSRSKVQIKPDTDYKFEKSPLPGTPRSQQEPTKTLNYNKEGSAVSRTVINAVSQTAATPSVALRNTPTKSSRSEKESTLDNHDKKEPNELARTLITRTTASGFKRPASIAVFESSVSISGEKDTQKRPEIVNGTGNRGDSNKTTAATESEVDTRPLSFKELKQAFAREQNGSVQTVPKFGSLGRRVENSANGTLVRRDNDLENRNSFRNEVNGQRTENNRSAASEKRNFAAPANRGGIAVFQHDVLGNARRTSRGTLMPVVKGFKVVSPDEEPATLSQDKSHAHRVAIGDISNGNYVAAQNGLRKTVVQIKGDNQSNNANCIPKPPPTMPVITGVTLKSTNANSRPKSMIVAADPRNDLLESIRGFGGSGQLRHVSRRNTNIGGGSGSRFVHS